MPRSAHDRHRYYRGIVGGEGCSGTPHAFMDCLRYIRTRKNKKKTKNKSNIRSLQKCPKRKKERQQHKVSNKKGKKEKEDRTRSKVSRYNVLKSKAKKK